MRVLHTYRTYFPDTQGGLEEVIRQICLNTQSEGVESRVLSLSRAQNRRVLHREEAVVYRARLDLQIASCGMSLGAIRQFKRLVDWADVVHYHYPWPFADLLHFGAKVTKPTVVTYHSDIVRQRILGILYQPLMSRFLGSVDSIVCTSPNYFATSDVLPKFANKVDVIPIGIDEASHVSPGKALIDEVKSEYGEGFFLFVGVLRYYKGLHILLEAMEKAPYKVVIVGSGPTELELKKQARELGLTNAIFTGYLEDDIKNALFQLCRGVVFPSYMRSEAFGVTLLEGAMYGKPLISTEVGSGTSHVNTDGETGIVVPPGSPKALRTAMDQMHFRPQMAQLMGNRARERFKRLFSGELMGKRYAERYRQLTGANRSTAVSSSSR